MKTVFDVSTQEELIGRIHSLSPQNQAQWGKMDVLQMVKHCTRCEDMYLGAIQIKRVLIGRLIGKMVLKKVLSDDAPFAKNSPTSSLLKAAKTDGDLALHKTEWENRIRQYANYNQTNFVHPFFGPMTREQVGLLAYKHIDHHLRQFGA